MINRSTAADRLSKKLRVVRATVVGAFLGGSLLIAFGAQVAVSAGPTNVDTSISSQAYQRSAQDKVAYLHDGSLLVGFYDGHTGAIDHVTNPSTSPVSTRVLTFLGGEEESLYVLPGSGTTEIWVQEGNEIFGGPRQEQIQHGTYDGSTFSWDGGNVNPEPVEVPGTLTNGRQDPSVVWTGQWLIASWWDDTVGHDSDNVFYNWTPDRTGKTGWAVTAKAGSVAVDNHSSSSTVVYNVVTGDAPAVNDQFQIGLAVSNNGSLTCDRLTTCNAEFRQVTGVTGTGPYTLTLDSPLVYHHNINEPIRIAAELLTATASNPVQVTIRHSAKLGATIAVYGAACKILSRTLLDGAADPSPANWTTQSTVDVDDCEGGPWLGGPQVAIDETSGDVHVFKAMTSGEPSPMGIIYWHGTPDAVPMSTGAITWGARLVIDPAHSSFESDPPDIAGAVDPTTHRVYVFWVTAALTGQLKYVTLDSPYTSASQENLVTTDAQPRSPHVPSVLNGAYVPLVYQSGTASPFSIVLDNTLSTSVAPDITPPTAPTGLTATATKTPEVDLKWNASTDNVGVAGYDIYRNGSTTPLATVSGATLVYADKAVTDATTYTYTVDAIDAAGNHSAQSAAATAKTPDITAPSAPASLTATPTPTPEVDLSWSASTDNVGVTGYDIYRNGSVTPLAIVSGSTTLTYADKAVTDATAYSYTVDAFDAAGNHSAKSAVAMATTPDITAPSVPASLTAKATPTPEVDLSWSASTDNVGVTGYTIYRDGSMLATVSGSTLTYADTAVVQTTSYSYRVDAFDAAGNHSAQSAPASVNTPDISPPSVPAGLSAALNASHGVTLTWSASSDNVGVAGYTVYRNGAFLTTVARVTYTDNSVSGLTTYTYTVDAFDAAGNHSAKSAAAQVTTGVAAPCQVPTVTAAPASPSLAGTRVTITASSSGCPDPLYEFWTLAPGGSWKVAQAYSSSGTFTWHTSPPAGTYYHSVWVRDASSASTYDSYVPGTAYVLTPTACSSVSASAAPASPQAAGTAVTISATAAGCPNPRFQFWIQPPGGSWAVAQAYSNSSIFNWNTSGSGVYHYSVWVRDASSSSSYDAYFPGTAYTVTSTACTAVSASASPASPQTAGTAVTISAASSGCPHPLYQFWIQPPGGAWTVAQAYSGSATFSWNTTGRPAGVYHYSVWVRDAASANSYDAYVPGTAYTLTTNACTSVSVTAAPASPQTAGASVTITAAASGCPSAQYEFWIQTPSGTWTIAQAYSSSNTFIWNTGGLPTGTYRYSVWVRDASSGASYDAFFPGTAYMLI